MEVMQCKSSKSRVLGKLALFSSSSNKAYHWSKVAFLCNFATFKLSTLKCLGGFVQSGILVFYFQFSILNQVRFLCVSGIYILHKNLLVYTVFQIIRQT